MIDRQSSALALLGAAAGVAAVRALLIEPKRLVVTTHVVRSRVERTRTVRIAQLADLHLRGLGTLERQVVHALRAARPDVLAITGDVISRRPTLGALDRFLERVEGVEFAFAVLGNWDRWSGVSTSELREIYARHRVQLLVNESEVVEIHGERLRVTGVDDLASGLPSARAGLEAAMPGETHLILSHCPGYREVLWREIAEAHARPGWSARESAQRPPALMLAGHTHGGQIRLLGAAPVRPRGSGRYVAGWYRDGYPHLYVSRGIGTSIAPVRLFAPPEMAVFDVELPIGDGSTIEAARGNHEA